MKTKALTVTRKNGALAGELVVGAVDIGHENPAYWIGALRRTRGMTPPAVTIQFAAWNRSPLATGTATEQQAFLVQRVLALPEHAVVTDWSLEQQLPHNRVTGRSNNIGAYGLQSALFGALLARPSAATRRVFVRSPRHKFSVLGVAPHLISKKTVRKRLVTRLTADFLERYTERESEARRIWAAARPKQDDLADTFVAGAIELLELDARSRNPLAADTLTFMRQRAQEIASELNPPVKPRSSYLTRLIRQKKRHHEWRCTSTPPVAGQLHFLCYPHCPCPAQRRPPSAGQRLTP